MNDCQSFLYFAYYCIFAFNFLDVLHTDFGLVLQLHINFLDGQFLEQFCLLLIIALLQFSF